MNKFRTMLLASLAIAFAGSAQAQSALQINRDAVRTAPALGPMRIAASPGFSLKAGAPTTALDLIDVNPNSAFVIEGPISMVIEGLVMVAARCTVYSGDRPIATFDRTAPVLDGAFAGRFRFGLTRTADGAPTRAHPPRCAGGTQAARPARKDYAPCTAPQLCNASDGGRRGFAQPSRTARPCQPVVNAGLYRCRYRDADG